MAMSSSTFVEELAPGLNAIFAREYEKLSDRRWSRDDIIDARLAEFVDCNPITDWARIGYMRVTMEAMEDQLVLPIFEKGSLISSRQLHNLDTDELLIFRPDLPAEAGEMIPRYHCIIDKNFDTYEWMFHFKVIE